jgi:hypothetical protein
MNPRQTLSLNQDLALPEPTNDFVRVPGLFRRWEIPQVVPPSGDYRVEPADTTADGTPVFSLYRRGDDTAAGAAGEDDDDTDVPVVVSFEDGRPPVRASLLPLEEGYPILGVLIARLDPDDEGLRVRVDAHLDRTAPSTMRPPRAPMPSDAPTHDASPCASEA